MPRIFSRTYDARSQSRFQEALEKGELEKAAEILENFPYYNTSPADPIFRTLALIEGYREIVRIYSEELANRSRNIFDLNEQEEIHDAIKILQ